MNPTRRLKGQILNSAKIGPRQAWGRTRELASNTTKLARQPAPEKQQLGGGTSCSHSWRRSAEVQQDPVLVRQCRLMSNLNVLGSAGVSVRKCVSWHRAMISPWAGVEHLDRSDSQRRQRVFVSCWACVEWFHCVYAQHCLGQSRRECEGRDWESGPGGLGLFVRRVLRSLRRGLRSRKDWMDGGEVGRRLDLP